MQTYRDLRVWQEGIEAVPMVYAVVRRLPKEERYDLGSQIRRAVVSIPANIAEGQGRRHAREFIQHLAIAKGSLAELETLLIVAERLEYASREEMTPLEAQLSRVGKLLNALLNRLEQTANRQPPTAN